MICGTHPDSITMAMVTKIAASNAGETGTLKFLKEYRDQYELAAFGEQGTLEYILQIDACIARWEAGQRPGTQGLCVPTMSFADTRLPRHIKSFAPSLDRLRTLISQQDPHTQILFSRRV
jgi:hypothetical protein